MTWEWVGMGWLGAGQRTVWRPSQQPAASSEQRAMSNERAPSASARGCWGLGRWLHRVGGVMHRS
jgi:hypothetical protein